MFSFREVSRMKLFLVLGMKTLVLWMVLSMGMSVGAQTHDGKDAFNALCTVLRHAEKVLNTTTTSEPVKSEMEKALYGSRNGLLTVQQGRVSVTGTCKGHVDRELLCTYSNGGHGCFAKSLAGTILCLCTPGQGGSGWCELPTLGSGNWYGDQEISGQRVKEKTDLFQNVWDKVRWKCIPGTEVKQSIDKEVDELKKALDAFLEKWRPIGRKVVNLGGQAGGNAPCSGTTLSNVCASYYTRGRPPQHVEIPWLTAMLVAIESLKQHEHATGAAPALPSVSGNSQAHTEPDVSGSPELSESTQPTNTKEGESTEDMHLTRAPLEHQASPTSMRKWSTTEGPAGIGTPSDNTSPLEDTLPTAAPFLLADGATLGKPLGSTLFQPLGLPLTVLF
ncbi:Variant surface glycoprotein [Trypanosoma congolense IL3000]|uniref:Variant surface glycoprotein n=1 Tax=Trypanosoma congolense (strain IL3000) TaxID=1068625 RepID=F9WHA4_TRYCI|nr:Variant surface glycoprotein [Trypanosoma congolense IL3000]